MCTQCEQKKVKDAPVIQGTTNYILLFCTRNKGQIIFFFYFYDIDIDNQGPRMEGSGIQRHRTKTLASFQE